MLQTEQYTKEEKEQKDREYLQTATEYCPKDIKAANELQKEEIRNRFIDSVGAN